MESVTNQNNLVGTQGSKKLSAKGVSKSSRRLFGYQRQAVPLVRQVAQVSGLNNVISNINVGTGSIAAGRSLTANYNAQVQIPNQRIVQPARVVQQYVQRRPQYTVNQLMQAQRPMMPMQVQRPMMPMQVQRPMMPMQVQRPMMPQQPMYPQQMMMPMQAQRPMMVPAVGAPAKTKTIKSGGKKVRVVVRKSGKGIIPGATATIKPKGKSAKKSKPAAKKPKKKLGIFAKMEEESSEIKVKAGETASIEAQLATSSSTKTKKAHAAKSAVKKHSKKASKKKDSKGKDSKKKSDKPERSTMMIPVYPSQQVAAPGARFLAQPGMVPVLQYQVPVQGMVPQQINQVQMPVQQPMLLG